MSVKYASPKKTVTIKDIAALAGVSYSCVSRALLDKDNIGEETKKRIVRLAEELNYQPNHIARNLVLGKTSSIGITVHSLTNPTSGEFLKYLFEEVEKVGFSLIVFLVDDPPSAKDFDQLNRKKVDGIILNEPIYHNTMFMQSFAMKQIPCVFYHNMDSIANSVTVDRSLGVYNAVNYLIQVGHRDFAYLCHPKRCRPEGNLAIPSSPKIDGFKKAIAENNLLFNDSMLVEGKGSVEDGYNKTRELLRRKKILPTAIIYNNDLSAMGGMGALSEHGIRIPEDVSVVGFDNIEISSHSVPPLTTIEQPHRKMAEETIRLILKRIENPEANYPQKTFTPKLIVRKSTGPARR